GGATPCRPPAPRRRPPPPRRGWDWSGRDPSGPGGGPGASTPGRPRAGHSEGSAVVSLHHHLILVTGGGAVAPHVGARAAPPEQVPGPRGRRGLGVDDVVGGAGRHGDVADVGRAVPVVHDGGGD